MDVDDVRVDRLDRFIIEPEPRHPRHANIVEKHVRLAQQRLELCLAQFFAPVDRHRFLVAVERHEDRPQIAGRRRSGIAHHVAGMGAALVLDLDHVRAHIGQHHRRQRTHDHARHVQHAHPCKRPGRRNIAYRPDCFSHLVIPPC
jgi:hypothetical protein